MGHVEVNLAQVKDTPDSPHLMLMPISLMQEASSSGVARDGDDHLGMYTRCLMATELDPPVLAQARSNSLEKNRPLAAVTIAKPCSLSAADSDLARVRASRESVRIKTRVRFSREHILL